MVFLPECSTLPGMVIIGGETPDVPVDLNTVVEQGEKDALRNNVEDECKGKLESCQYKVKDCCPPLTCMAEQTYIELF